MSDAPAEIEFLTARVILALHQRQLERFGGGFSQGRRTTEGDGHPPIGLRHELRQGYERRPQDDQDRERLHGGGVHHVGRHAALRDEAKRDAEEEVSVRAH